MDRGAGSKLVSGEGLSLGQAFRAPNLVPIHWSANGKLLSVGQAFNIPGSQLLLYRRGINATMNKGAGSTLVRGEESA
eukprot:2448293-Heterocapsa_arctica.AAC.1